MDSIIVYAICKSVRYINFYMFFIFRLTKLTLSFLLMVKTSSFREFLNFSQWRRIDLAEIAFPPTLASSFQFLTLIMPTLGRTVRT